MTRSSPYGKVKCGAKAPTTGLTTGVLPTPGVACLPLEGEYASALLRRHS